MLPITKHSFQTDTPIILVQIITRQQHQPNLAELTIAGTANTEQFKVDLKEHQQGKTDYLTFIAMCAAFGIEKWAVCMDKMTCTYYDTVGNEILVEKIPNSWIIPLEGLITIVPAESKSIQIK